ncbi:cysteine-rich receptor-like protein kinase 15 [Diospyros lotus]|uniref:cysteine-rich receptor-like protein kinase 15 n=1 Tax=Diospyros lotus TaxID=55363 RepID=UPI002257B33E|nr:cysteine-rich receptor-like protein kinase 15 [Diospyros lotus]
MPLQDRIMKDPNPILLIIFLLSFLSFTSNVIGSQRLYNLCTNASIYDPKGTYRANLDTLLSALSTAANTSGFYNSSAGSSSSDQVHGLFLCRHDVSTQACRDCVADASGEIVQLCPKQREAIIWYDNCMLQYSNQSVFSNKGKVLMLNSLKIDASSLTQFRQVLGETMGDIATQAARNEPGTKFAINETKIMGNQQLYTLAQCTPHLSISACNSCIADAISRLPNCCDGMKSARVLTSSCHVRYDIFYLNTTASLPASVVPPPRSPNSPESGSHGSKGKKIIISISASGAAMLLGAALLGSYFYLSKRKKKEDNQEAQLKGLVGGMLGNDYNIGQTKSQDLPTIQLDLILAATAHFSEKNKLGQGGFGPVYKGVLPDGREIAVKRLSRTSVQGLQEFKNEVILIAKLQHKNLVRLLGCCLEGSESLLVYEYMPNKSLDFFLFDSTKSVELDWKRRLLIINGIARGILYLHEDSRLKIIHRDLKASNVLLDDKMNPKISDFGMAKIFSEDQNEANTNRAAGTYGYMAPEYAMEGLFSVKSDVFSFGVLLLEIISGKRSNGFYLYEQGYSLLTYAWKLWTEGQAQELIDRLLVDSSQLNEVLKCMHIGLLCVQEDPMDRPTMSSVVVMLANNTLALSEPTRPAFSVGRRVLTSPQPVASVNEVTLSDVLPR